MLLFKSDWDSFPNAIADAQTTNKSFLRYSALLKSMGIENHLWPLALMNPALQGVDPFDPNLSVEQMAMIAIEAKVNPFYYIREIARIPGRGSLEPVPFRANRGVMALFWLFFNHVTVMLIMIRQTGKSVGIDTLLTYLSNIHCNKTDFVLMTKDEALRSVNAERLKDIQNELPFYLNQRSRGDVGNTEEISVKNMENSIRLILPSKSPKDALNKGRGFTTPIMSFDETAFLYNIEITMPAALAAGTAARHIARQMGSPYGTILATTAGKKDDRDGKFIYGLLCNSAVWTEGFFDTTNEEELHSVVRRASPTGELRVNCTFNHKQLGYTDAWLKQAIEEAMVSGEAADRDFFNVWTSGTLQSPLTVEQMKIIRDSQQDHRVTIGDGYVTRWYIPIDQIEQHLNSGDFVMGIDTSDAVGNDDIAMTLRDTRTGAVVAAGNYNETNLITFANWLIRHWIVKYTRITVNIERRSSGAVIIDYLLLMLVSEGIDPFKRLFNRVVNDAFDEKDRFKEIDKPMYARDPEIYVRYKKHFGFATSATGLTSRTELYSTTLLAAVKYTGDRVHDKTTIDQILGLTVRNGRVDHSEGEHDDSCITWLLSYWTMTQAKNLSYYGIDPRKVLIDSEQNRQDNSPQKVYERQLQDHIRDQIEALIEQIKGERNDMIVMKHEHQLELLIKKLSSVGGEIKTYDGLIAKLQEEKQKSRGQYSGLRRRY